ncbi:MAG: DUF885 domain-containing protein [Ignavibacteriae bacterium HGW-Ignavibacteriae-4]|jgi:uncharacterized protein (DUF885 family)|nr:MAG: DUF885 domain-containing protein [Ignavibacteriae bacterium HGW-Ignavibacteriae-4]
MKYFILLLSILLFSCTDSPKPINNNQNVEFNKWLDSVWLAKVNRFPALQTEYGYRTNDDKWDNISDSMQLAELDILTKNIVELSKNFKVSNLTDQSLLSYKIYLYNVETELAGAEYIYHVYPVSQMDGWHTKIPSTLINQHTINNKKDADNYLSRVNNVPEVINQLIDNLKRRESKGIVAPVMILDYVIQSSKNLILNSKNTIDNHPIYKDFKSKTAKINIDLDSEIRKAITDNFSVAYQNLVIYLNELKKASNEEIGAWSLKNGVNYYNYQIKLNNTIDITSDEIYQYGLSEVERIHNEMIKIKDNVGFKGDLNSFFKFMREDKQFYFPNTLEGKQMYLDSAKSIINSMKQELPKLFNVIPKTELMVKSVEPFREQSAGTAFYETPSIDGKRPGIYYANLYNMADMPIYQMEALAYHEGIPGHHMQIAISQELEGIPKFRSIGNLYVSYVEGWGLYSELLPKEIGYYSNPYSDFGRLAMELWRACRLVVDVGIHAKKWDRQTAIDYYNNNTPATNSESIGMVDRHIVMPGQATGYKLGMRHILDLREKAKKSLKDKFDIKKFHDLVLKDGPVPLFVLSETINNWIVKNKSNNSEQGEINETDALILTDPTLGK